MELLFRNKVEKIFLRMHFIYKMAMILCCKCIFIFDYLIGDFMNILECCMLTITPDRPLKFNQSPKIRGFMSEYFHNELFANRSNNTIRYKSSFFQYKIISGKIMIVGISDGAKILLDVKDKIRSIKLKKQLIEIEDSSLMYGNQYIGYSSNSVKYKFLTPWVALNQKNYRRYMNSNSQQQHTLLKDILIGNIISFCKNFGYSLDERIGVEKLEVDVGTSYIKENKMISFTGSFDVNFMLPQYWGIGRSPSRGFGTVVQA